MTVILQLENTFFENTFINIEIKVTFSTDKIFTGKIPGDKLK